MGRSATTERTGRAGTSDRLAHLHGRNLREQAARGTLINSGFQVGFAGLGLLRRFVVAAYLTRAQFGIWSIVLTTVMTVGWLKQVGVSDKYVQQDEPDQEAAFQKAFTIELATSIAFFVLIAALLPAYSLAYATPKIIVPGIVLALSVPISALESPIWIPYRRMQFGRQRTLAAVDPVVSLVVTIALAVAGAGYWALVLGVLAGSVAGATAAVLSCPYPLRLRMDRATLKEYVTFSWPLFGLSVLTLVVVQGMLLVSSHAVGLAGLGAIGLAASIATFASNVDAVISQALYPVVCAVSNSREKLFEAFVKSNRLALVWAMPFGVGLALFSADLVHYAFGPRWDPAIGLIGAMGLISAVSQVAYNYSIFFRAVNDTRPLFRLAILSAASFFLIAVPLILTLGLTGYALGWGAMTLVQLAGRGWYLSKLFAGFRLARHLLRAIAPSVPAATAVLAVRLVEPAGRSEAMVIGELALYVLVTIAATAVFERPLMREVGGYLRNRWRPAPA
ncbi:MAG TPA: oligosaccharide flippase family protein [Thermoleophilaceae bacterium]|jgi:PST family polysaccharide transporter